MDFQLDIKVTNLGKIKQAEISINRATIFAGLNSTGKSYVSKFLYSLLDSLNTDLEAAYLVRKSKELTESIREIIMPSMRIPKSSKKKEFTISFDSLELISSLDGMHNIFSREIQLLSEEVEDNEDKFIKTIKKYITYIRKLSKILRESLDEIEIEESDKIKEMKKNQIVKFNKKRNKTRKTFQKIEGICDEIINYKEKYNDQESISKTYEERLAHNLIHNFQISSVSDLIGSHNKKNAIVELSIQGDSENKIKCTITSEDSIALSYDNGRSPLNILKNFSRVIYLSSPVYWELEKPLKRATRTRAVNDNPDKVLTGVPKYFSDLLDIMDVDRAGKSKIKFDVKKIVKGKIMRDKKNSLVYMEASSGKEYRLTSTATGIVQLAFIAYLVESQVIKKDAVIFIDEPEAHLHPAWQNIMIELLFKLAKQEVNIILATHSPNNIQWLQSEMSENDELQEYVALNHFQKNGIIKANKSLNNTCAKVLVELTEPFANEYLRSL